MLRLNPGSTRGASHHAAFMFNWPTIIHTICQCQSKILSCCLCVNKKKWGAGWMRVVESFSADLPAIEN